MTRKPVSTKFSYPDLMMVYTDPLFRIRWMSPALCERLGFLTPDTSFQKFSLEIPFNQQQSDSESWQGDLLIKAENGSCLKISGEFKPLFDHHNKLSGWLTFIQLEESPNTLFNKVDQLINLLLEEKQSNLPQEPVIRQLIGKLEQLLPKKEQELPLRPVSSIWIVDDDSVITYITRRLIHSVDPGVEIREFLSAKMALEKLRIDGVPPDLILLDINMPGITGWSFLDQLNQLSQQVEVYMYSTSIDPEDVKKAREYQIVRDFLPKPLDNKIIRRILNFPAQQHKVS